MNEEQISILASLASTTSTLGLSVEAAMVSVEAVTAMLSIRGEQLDVALKRIDRIEADLVDARGRIKYLEATR